LRPNTQYCSVKEKIEQNLAPTLPLPRKINKGSEQRKTMAFYQQLKCYYHLDPVQWEMKRQTIG
jgi:hypothetical protein